VRWQAFEAATFRTFRASSFADRLLARLRQVRLSTHMLADCVYDNFLQVLYLGPALAQDDGSNEEK
jgi:hypothetical protein